MADSDYPQAYLDFSNQSAKELNVVVEIQDAPALISMLPLFKRAVYGDPDLKYGMPGLVYGGLIPYGTDIFKPLLSLESNLTISQRIEPEQGKGDVSTLTLVFVDIDQYMTRLMTPGLIINEPLGNKFITVKLGYKNTSFPQDYFTIFRGYISNVRYTQGKYYLQISDPNSKRRGQVFFTPKNKLTTSINDSTTTIPFLTDNYYQQILGPDGLYDSAVKIYLQIDDEVMEYGPTDVQPTQVINVTRGSRDTTASSHNADAEVSNRIQIEDNAINIALKIMLSGWGGDWLTDVPVLSIQDTIGTSGIIANAVLLPIGVSATDAYGLYPGDYVTFSGSVSGNDGTKVLAEIQSINGGINNLLLFTTDFVAVEEPATTVRMSFRSQFDTFPVEAGLRLTPKDVDVATHISFRNDFFSQDEYRLRFYMQDPEKAKDWMELQIMLPLGAYSITRFGRISMTMARPPIAGILLHTLSHNDVVDPNSIEVERGINNRMYFDEIKYSYDLNEVSGEFDSVRSILDSQSLSNIDVPTVLPIESTGMRTDLGSLVAISRRGGFLISRYKDAAITIKLKTNWRAGSIIETGDVVLVKDDGQLQITNFETGERNLHNQLFEVINRNYDIKTGVISLTLMSGIGFQINDRFGTISPSSLVVAGSTASRIRFEDSFGILFPRDEKAKWEALVGQRVEVHSYDYSNRSESILLPFSPTEPYVMNVAPPLNYTPSAGDIIDVAPYPTDTDPTNQLLCKNLFCYLDPTVPIVSGISSTEFEVSPSDIGLFNPGLPVLERNSSYSAYSNESIIDSVDTMTNIVNMSTSFDIAPSDAEFAEGIGFPDITGPYRFI